jgi:hypothetical protein
LPESTRKLFDVRVQVHAELVVEDVSRGLGVGVPAPGGGARHPGRQHHEVEEVAPDERDVLDLGFLDQPGDPAFGRLHEGRLPHDRDLLRVGGAQLERDVDRAGLRGLEPDVLLDPGLEAGERHLHGVG